MLTRIINSILMLMLANGIGHASLLTLLPSSGSIPGAPGMTIGWGYVLDNTSADWLVPIGLTLNNPADGSVVDIFDYPIVPPNSTITRPYTFGGFGGPGNSTGLMEYTVPAGLEGTPFEGGTVILQFQLFDGNPDADPFAMPIGSADRTPDLGYSVTLSQSAVPEPGTGTYLFIAILAVSVVHTASSLRSRTHAVQNLKRSP